MLRITKQNILDSRKLPCNLISMSIGPSFAHGNLTLTKKMQSTLSIPKLFLTHGSGQFCLNGQPIGAISVTKNSDNDKCKGELGYCVGQFCPVFQLCERKGPAQYPVWGEMNIRGHPAEEWTKLPSEEMWSVSVRNWVVSEDDGHLGTFVRDAWRTC